MAVFYAQMRFVSTPVDTKIFLTSDAASRAFVRPTSIIGLYNSSGQHSFIGFLLGQSSPTKQIRSLSAPLLVEDQIQLEQHLHPSNEQKLSYLIKITSFSEARIKKSK